MRVQRRGRGNQPRQVLGSLFFAVTGLEISKVGFFTPKAKQNENKDHIKVTQNF